MNQTGLGQGGSGPGRTGGAGEATGVPPKRDAPGDGVFAQRDRRRPSGDEGLDDMNEEPLPDLPETA